MHRPTRDHEDGLVEDCTCRHKGESTFISPDQIQYMDVSHPADRLCGSGPDPVPGTR
ncbi:hypothetical protein ACNKHQ_23545 [Shigella flexneri]